MSKKHKLPLKKITRLIVSHLRHSSAGKNRFAASGAALDAAIGLGAPLETPIELPDGRTVMIRDQFAQNNTAFSAKMFQRYKVEETKESKRKTKDAAAVASVTESEGV
jgi:hypothetical protein